ncbi:hypothetical protein [Lysinibacter sp. HNR]|uniref:hypothetical protein n=1 Tax=Lysinibacter sp. HNR TaxID=3031408 RepID=UPI0024353796|nr:hypothetical protein [Lysinibacter sp. HNR]WGD36729.1 hypothetical protein FrondiHNR_09705 [Lysinibacter sp. HNR]
MSRVTVVCGAGVSSTFLVQSMTEAMRSRMPKSEYVLSASTILLLRDHGPGDIILLGSHLANQRDIVAREYPLARVVILSERVVRERDGNAALDLVLSVLND